MRDVLKGGKASPEQASSGEWLMPVGTKHGADARKNCTGTPATIVHPHHNLQEHVLKIMEKTFRVSSIEPQAQPLKVGVWRQFAEGGLPIRWTG